MFALFIIRYFQARLLKFGGHKVKEYFISEIDIKKLYHLSNIKIQLDSKKWQHLLLTGKMVQGKLHCY